MRASAPTAFPNLNILRSLAGSFVNETILAGAGNLDQIAVFSQRQSKMSRSRWLILYLAGAAILFFTQFPFGATMLTRTDCASASYRVCEVSPP